MDQTTFDAARQVIAFAELSSVRILRCNVAATPGTMDLDERVSLSIGTKTQARRFQAGKFVCTSKFDLKAKVEGSELDRIGISVEFEAIYTIAEHKNLSLTQLKAFASTNGLLNVWPYWRELVQSFTLRAGLPGLTLPLFRVHLARPESKAPPQS